MNMNIGKYILTQGLYFRFLNGIYAIENFRFVDWILNLIPLRPSFRLTSTDHWSWFLISLDFIDLRFSLEVFGFGLTVDILKTCSSRRIEIIDERKEWGKLGVWNGKEFDYNYRVPLFGGIRCLTMEIALAEGWDVFYFDFDFSEWFGGVTILFLDYFWKISKGDNDGH